MTLPSKFLALAPADRWLVCEAALALALASFLILIVPFRFLARRLVLAPESATDDERQIAKICRAVEVAARHVPFNAVCLPQAMAAKVMLARRGLGSSFHLGAGLSEAGAMSAHAWLESGGRVLIGSAGVAAVTPLARFG